MWLRFSQDSRIDISYKRIISYISRFLHTFVSNIIKKKCLTANNAHLLLIFNVFNVLNHVTLPVSSSVQAAKEKSPLLPPSVQRVTTGERDLPTVSHKNGSFFSTCPVDLYIPLLCHKKKKTKYSKIFEQGPVFNVFMCTI